MGSIPACFYEKSIAIKNQGMREKVFNETIELLKLGGYKGLHMTDLARQAGISKKTLYDEFGNKEGVVVSALKNEFDSMYHDLEMISLIAGLDVLERLSASLWLITRRAFECSKQLVEDLKVNPVIQEQFWQHVQKLNNQLLQCYLQNSTVLNEIMLTNFFGILINVASGKQHGVDRVKLMQETIQFYTYAWAHMENGLYKKNEPVKGS